jgi:cobalt-zinc-cadmium efflux system membrane fusion protein
LFALCLLPLAYGHEGHDDSPSKSGNNSSPVFLVAKETQFLFEVLTEKIETGNFTESTKLFGTVTPSSGGKAVVASPQSGKIYSLNVNVGQQVSKGQLLAIVEQNIDAGTQVNLLSEKNNIDAELDAAKKNYDHIKAIEDIAAKKDVAEAEARYKKAQENKKVFDNLTANSSGNSKLIFLKSPIAGLVGNFTFSLGATVNSGEELFSVTNLNKVYVEAQVFDRDAEKVLAGKRFTVECTNNHKTSEVKLISMAQSINATNQSQRVLFEMENPGGEFKIGEFVNVRVFAGEAKKEIAVPNSAISELNGKSIVFLKDVAESYSMVYVNTGENNGSFTTIKKGIEDGERVVVNGTYQMKMIYLNQ